MLIDIPESIPATQLIQALSFAGLRITARRYPNGAHRVEQIPQPGKVVFVHPRHASATPAPEVA